MYKVLERERKKRGLTQEEVASRIGIARSTYANYERGIREPDNETLKKIADLFGVSMDYLFGRTSKTDSELTEEERKFIDDLELSDDELIKKYNLLIDGKEATEEEKREMIAYIRAKRIMTNLN